METLYCKCRNCQTQLAPFINLWTQIGKTYFSPVLEATGDLNVISQGSTRVGEPDTLVAECGLQDIACAKCNKVVGLKCLSSPINHVLNESQILLRQSSVLFLDNKNNPVELNIRRTLKLRVFSGTGPQKRQGFQSSTEYGHQHETGANANDAPYDSDPADFIRMQADLEIQREDIERIDTAGYRVVSQFNDTVGRINLEIKKLNETMTELRREVDKHRKDLGSVNTSVSEVRHMVQHNPGIARLEKQCQSASTAVAKMQRLCGEARSETDELREELQATRNDLRRLENTTSSLREDLASAGKATKDAINTARGNAENMANLQMELNQLKETLYQDSPKIYPPNHQSLIPRELDILASNISKIGNRANQVEALQMELDLFKSRVQRLEAAAESFPGRREEFSLKSDLPKETSKALEAVIDSRREPTLFEQDHGIDNPSTENRTSSTGMLRPRDRKRKAASERPSSTQGAVSGPRLTRSGAIDKRTTKKQKISSVEKPGTTSNATKY